MKERIILISSNMHVDNPVELEFITSIVSDFLKTFQFLILI